MTINVKEILTRKTIFSIIGAVAACFAILGGLWAFEDRYAKSIEIVELEIQVVQSLKQYNIQQMEVQQRYEYKNEYKFYQFMYDKLAQDLLEIRRQLRRDPTDAFLRQDYTDVTEQRKLVKAKMEKLMEKIK